MSAHSADAERGRGRGVLEGGVNTSNGFEADGAVRVVAIRSRTSELREVVEQGC
jgi:hypothetical protein